MSKLKDLCLCVSLVFTAVLLLWNLHQASVCSHMHVNDDDSQFHRFRSISYVKATAADTADGTATASTASAPQAADAAEAAAAALATGLAALKFNMRHWLDLAAADAAFNGADANSADCTGRWGEQFVSNFAAAKVDLCPPAAAMSSDGNSSSGSSSSSSSSSSSTSSSSSFSSAVTCNIYPLSYGLACTSNNLILTDSATFMGPHPTAPKLEDHLYYMPVGVPGSVQLDCVMNESRGPEGVGLNEAAIQAIETEKLPWFKSAYVHANTSDVRRACKGEDNRTRVLSNPLIIVTRVDPTNPFHHMQSFVQLFATLATALGDSKAWGQRPDAMQLLLADHFEDGPMMDIWSKLSAPHPVIHLKDNTLTGPSCVRKAIHSHYSHPAWTIFSGDKQDGCKSDCVSSLMLATAHWQRFLFLELLPEPDRLYYIPPRLRTPASSSSSSASSAVQQSAVQQSAVQPLRHRRLHVILASRDWFERGMTAGAGLNSFQSSRSTGFTPREPGAAAVLQKAVVAWNEHACTPASYGWWQLESGASAPKKEPHPAGSCKQTNVTFDFQMVEFSLMDFSPDNVHLMSRSAVIVGIHGAALTNMWLMKPFHGAVVELYFPPNEHFYNLAHSLGHAYTPIKYQYPKGFDDKELTDAVMKSMDFVSSKY